LTDAATLGVVTYDVEATMPAQPKKRRTALTVTLVLVFVVVLGAGAYLLKVKPWVHEPTFNEQAIARCHDVVLKSIVSPATAKFVGDENVEIRGKQVVVTGEIDAENRFSALLRTKFWCGLTYDHGTWGPSDVLVDDHAY
jgi:hypothetical protein